VSVGPSSGPTAIALVAADPMPGTTIAGCGAHSSGCAGRIRLTFRLAPTKSGPVLYCVGFLHATDKTGCLQGRTGAFNARAGEPQTIEVVFDQVDASDRCRTPLDLTDLALERGRDGRGRVSTRMGAPLSAGTLGDRVGTGPFPDHDERRDDALAHADLPCPFRAIRFPWS